MKISLHDVRTVEKYLRNRLSESGAIRFARAFRSDPALRRTVSLQRRTYRLIRAFHRRKLKDQLMNIHARLFSDPEKLGFQESVYRMFEVNEK